MSLCNAWMSLWLLHRPAQKMPVLFRPDPALPLPTVPVEEVLTSPIQSIRPPAGPYRHTPRSPASELYTTFQPKNRRTLPCYKRTCNESPKGPERTLQRQTAPLGIQRVHDLQRSRNPMPVVTRRGRTPENSNTRTRNKCESLRQNKKNIPHHSRHGRL